MADRGAIERAAMGGGMGGTPDDMDPAADHGAPDGQGQDHTQGVAMGMKAVGDYIQNATQAGKPGADKALGLFKSLLQSLATMEGMGPAQDGTKGPEGAQEDPNNPRMEMGPGTGPAPVRSFSKGKPAGTFRPSVVV